jgi:hypothetical protein
MLWLATVGAGCRYSHSTGTLKEVTEEQFLLVLRLSLSLSLRERAVEGIRRYVGRMSKKRERVLC